LDKYGLSKILFHGERGRPACCVRRLAGHSFNQLKKKSEGGWRGYEPQFGARPLKRAIQEHLLDPLATKLLAGEFKPGDRIKVGAKNGELAFGKR